MHGLYSWNVTCRVITSMFGRELKSFRAGFASPVRPGDTLQIQMWECGKHEQGGKEIRFIVKVEEKIVLKDGVAVIREKDMQAKL